MSDKQLSVSRDKLDFVLRYIEEEKKICKSYQECNQRHSFSSEAYWKGSIDSAIWVLHQLGLVNDEESK